MIVDELKPLLGSDEFEHEVCDGGYGEFLNLVLRREAGRLTMVMKFDHDLVGSPMPPALHGGAIAGMMEVAAYCQLVWDLEMTKIPKTVDMNIDYLRSGKLEDLYAEAEVVRMGRRFANLHVTAWQNERSKPIATAHLHFLVIDDA